MSEINASLKKRIIRGFFWLSSLTFLGQIITWSVTLIVIRLLKPEDYGLMAMASVYIGFLTLLNEVGLGAAIIQKTEINEKELKKVFGFVIVINTGLLCFVFTAAPLLASFFSEPHLVPILRVLSINFILLSFYFLPQSMLIRELEFRKKSLIDLFGNLFSSAIVLTMALYGFGVWALIWGMVGMHLFKAIAFNTQRNLRYWPIFSIKGIRRMLSFGGYVSLNRILWYFYSQADIIIAGRLFGKELLGIYSVAMYIISLPLNKISPLFIQIGLPAFSRIQENLQSIQSNFLKLVRLLNVFSFPGFIGMAIIAPEAIPLLLGPKWVEVIIPIQILCLAMPFRFMSILFPPVVTARGRPEVIAGNMMFAIIIMPAAFLIGSRWGIIGLCYAWITAFPVLFIIMAKRTLSALELPLKALFSTFLIPFLGSSVMVLGMFAFKWKISVLFPPLWSVIVLIITGIILYSLTVLLLNRNAFKEIRILFSTT